MAPANRNKRPLHSDVPGTPTDNVAVSLAKKDTPPEEESHGRHGGVVKVSKQARKYEYIEGLGPICDIKEVTRQGVPASRTICMGTARSLFDVRGLLNDPDSTSNLFGEQHLPPQGIPIHVTHRHLHPNYDSMVHFQNYRPDYQSYLYNFNVGEKGDNEQSLQRFEVANDETIDLMQRQRHRQSGFEALSYELINVIPTEKDYNFAKRAIAEKATLQGGGKVWLKIEYWVLNDCSNPYFTSSSNEVFVTSLMPEEEDKRDILHLQKSMLQIETALSKNVLAKLGKGVKISLRLGKVYVRNLMDNQDLPCSVFIESTMHKMMVFMNAVTSKVDVSLYSFDELLGMMTTRDAERVLKLEQGKEALIFDYDLFMQVLEKAPEFTYDILNKLYDSCIINISFIKGVRLERYATSKQARKEYTDSEGWIKCHLVELMLMVERLQMECEHPMHTNAKNIISGKMDHVEISEDSANDRDTTTNLFNNGAFSFYTDKEGTVKLL
uniref:MH2 domain-containing protein n=1 Tax=Rhabditophanes sp. KR3021 TaxID=114890 RepID=A0AC35TQC6_9BILA